MNYRKDQAIFELKNALPSLRAISAHLGPQATARLTAALIWRRLRGQPWRELPPPSSERERASREQAGPAILLFRLLQDHVDREKALTITAEILRESAVRFLAQVVPIVRREDYAGVAESRQRELLADIANRFPNGEINPPLLAADAWFGYDVVYCHFPPLCKAVGEPDLAPLFCRGDQHFFDTCQPAVTMKRTATIAEGGAVCDFRFYWK
jgi:L-2-amino-thiazoline-4-carboxylic acid hydrolase